MSLDKLFQTIEKGGSGSGNFGHSGVPGHRGGSAAQGGAGGGMSSLSPEDYHKKLREWKSPIKVGKKLTSDEEYEQAKTVLADLQGLVGKENRPAGYREYENAKYPDTAGWATPYGKLFENSMTLETRIQAYERRTGKKKFKPDHMVHGRGGHLQ